MDFEVAALGMYHLSSLRLAFERSERLDSFNSALVTYEFGLPNSQQFQARRKSGLTRLFNLTIFFFLLLLLLRFLLLLQVRSHFLSWSQSPHSSAKVWSGTCHSHQHWDLDFGLTQSCFFFKGFFCSIFFFCGLQRWVEADGCNTGTSLR
jgi:hypothetical protein